MQIIHSLENPTKNPIALTIGNFDGVHIGHQAIFKQLRIAANARQLTPAAMTFTPHARHLFHEIDNYLITTPHAKSALIQQAGIDLLWEINFDEAFARLSADAFIARLIEQLQVKYVLIGDDFRFGHRGEGDFAHLQSACERANITVEQSPTVNWQGERVSSSRIRAAIQSAQFDVARQLLGRDLCYRETVIYGQQIGRTLDYPTANLSFDQTLCLPNGVFAVSVGIDESAFNESAFDENACIDADTTHPLRWPALCNIGKKPTIGHHQRLVEVHILDFNQSLYGKSLTIYPHKKLRNEQTFADLTALKAQIQADEAAARVFFNLPPS
ncbi:riboflavin biosynthesis protein RibF [Ostreibacterium oceani]|uniref:Riboflavin biosynthesis protein n=1 Tax=Ostreibacterium oceani TaxID=2654998 RepID=A0A6N7ESX1_9GAMM|nr:riboflavin biosynthesis protein RibF [Ostreibacterium oceani]MPV85641.1 riboflavin biosynthesis protein RibF [Ostreibacterium oceani]